MRAAVHSSYGTPSVLHVEDVERPVPEPDEVLVRIVASTVNRTDCGFRLGKPRFIRLFSGLRRPKFPILGTEFAGVVDEVGAAVTEFAVGDEVFGVNATRFGTHAEFVCVKQGAPIVKKPVGLSFDGAAAVSDGFVLALTCLRGCKVGAGDRLLIYGASGAIGTAAVQLAKHLGAQVTAVCNTANVDIVCSLGADEVVDYQSEGFGEFRGAFDAVFDAVGKTSFSRWRTSIVRGGIYASTDFGPRNQNPFLVIATLLPIGRTVKIPLPRYRKSQVEMVRDLIEAGEYRAVVDRTYPLEQIVEATEYVETEQKTGSVVITVAPGHP